MIVFRKTLLHSPFLFRVTPCFLTTHSPNFTTLSDEPTSAYYDDLINAAGRQRDFTTVFHLLNKRVRDGCFNTKSTFKFLSSDLSIVDDLLQTLARLDKGYPRKSAYDSLVAGLCRLHSTEEALRVAEAMVRGNHGANAATFYPILNALTKKKQMEEAWRVMELMREYEIRPDVTAYNYLLTAYCFMGDVEEAAAVLKEMEEGGMEADTRTYDALVLGACRAGKVEGAMVILRRMMDDGVGMLYSTHAHVIGVLVKMGYYGEAVEFVMSNGGRDKELDRENFGILAFRLFKLKRFDEANFLLEEMRKRDLPIGPNLNAMPRGSGILL